MISVFGCDGVHLPITVAPGCQKGKSGLASSSFVGCDKPRTPIAKESKTPQTRRYTNLSLTYNKQGQRALTKLYQGSHEVNSTKPGRPERLMGIQTVSELQ